MNERIETMLILEPDEARKKILNIICSHKTDVKY